MDQTDQKLLVEIIRDLRWAGLATVDGDGAPHASMVAYVPEEDRLGLLLHLSRLSRHTRNLFANPTASLIISQPDPLSGDPQTLARITLTGQVEVIERDSAAWEAGRDRYLAALPDSERLFGFKDFTLFRFRPHKARYIGGFARAFSLTEAQLTDMLIAR
ncbi:MAG: pyridoxamine 5'-phosphate oxidase [Myxococcales bacterium]|nr:pyridoxamine 5'-phosphate oxidase [Myxococcales bacterium]